MTRTTLAIDSDILELVRDMAAARGVSMGDIVNSLIKKGLYAREETRVRNGFTTFGGTSRFGLAEVEAADDAADAGYARFFR